MQGDRVPKIGVNRDVIPRLARRFVLAQLPVSGHRHISVPISDGVARVLEITRSACHARGIFKTPLPSTSGSTEGDDVLGLRPRGEGSGGGLAGGVDGGVVGEGGVGRELLVAKHLGVFPVVAGQERFIGRPDQSQCRRQQQRPPHQGVLETLDQHGKRRGQQNSEAAAHDAGPSARVEEEGQDEDVWPGRRCPGGQRLVPPRVLERLKELRHLVLDRHDSKALGSWAACLEWKDGRTKARPAGEERWEGEADEGSFCCFLSFVLGVESEMGKGLDHG